MPAPTRSNTTSFGGWDMSSSVIIKVWETLYCGGLKYFLPAQYSIPSSGLSLTTGSKFSHLDMTSWNQCLVSWSGRCYVGVSSGERHILHTPNSIHWWCVDFFLFISCRNKCIYCCYDPKPHLFQKQSACLDQELRESLFSWSGIEKPRSLASLWNAVSKAQPSTQGSGYRRPACENSPRRLRGAKAHLRGAKAHLSRSPKNPRLISDLLHLFSKLAPHLTCLCACRLGGSLKFIFSF